MVVRSVPTYVTPSCEKRLLGVAIETVQLLSVGSHSGLSVEPCEYGVPSHVANAKLGIARLATAKKEATNNNRAVIVRALK